MKIAVIVTSVIEPSSNGNFLFTPTRSPRSFSQRLQQTIFTISCLRNTISNADIYLIDGSVNNHCGYFFSFDNVKFIHLQSARPDLTDIVNSHTNKSYCEAVLIEHILDTTDMNSYDYILKVSGRYFFEQIDNSVFNTSNLDCYLFKQLLEYPAVPGYDMVYVDTPNGKVIRQYCSVIYGFGKHRLLHYRQTLTKIMSMTQHQVQYYMEAMLYHYLVDQPTTIVPWKVLGWDGASNDNQMIYY